jgi:hypothetical protein
MCKWGCAGNKTFALNAFAFLNDVVVFDQATLGLKENPKHMKPTWQQWNDGCGTVRQAAMGWIRSQLPTEIENSKARKPSHGMPVSHSGQPAEKSIEEVGLWFLPVPLFHGEITSSEDITNWKSD